MKKWENPQLKNLEVTETNEGIAVISESDVEVISYSPYKVRCIVCGGEGPDIWSIRHRETCLFYNPPCTPDEQPTRS